MLRLKIRWEGRKNFSTLMCRVVVVVVVTMPWLVSGATEPLHPAAEECQKNNSTLTLVCKAKDSNTEYQLGGLQWQDIRKVIINNATRLVLKEPSCRYEKMEVEVHNSGHVTTEPGSGDCAQQLVLDNCANVVIEDGVNLVRMISSKAQKIDLPRVSQFDLEDSWVKEVSVNVDEHKSTFMNSRIELVKKLVINGSFDFTAKDSTLVRVKRLEFHSRKPRPTIFKNVTVGALSHNGFLMQEGVLTLEKCLIENVASEGLLVKGGAELIIESSILKSVVYDSILVSQGGKVSFRNVTVGQESEIFFTIPEVSMTVFPLTMLGKFHSGPPLFWVAMSLLMGLAVGGAAGVTVMFYVLQRRGTFKADSETDGISLLPTQPSNLTSTSQPGSNPSSKDPFLQSLPPPPTRPIPAVPNNQVKAENKDRYADAASQPLPAQSRAPQRPLLPVPNQSASTSDLVKPKTRPNVPKRNNSQLMANNGARDFLPPPPPPVVVEEDLYDDVADLPTTTHPLPTPHYSQ